MADVRHGPTLLHGCLVRFCADPPKYNRKKLRKLRKFVQRYMMRYDPISADADVSLETWLENTNSYSLSRKNELRRVWEDHCYSVISKDLSCESFGKTETYVRFKAARGINSRSDVFKCAVGPFFKLMETEVYKDPAFIKHVPVCDRPRYIQDMLGCYPGPFYETDYSQFEKHFVPEVMLSIEMELYRHMLKNFPATYALIKKAMTGKNTCHFKHLTLEISGRRMSGEMCTSLGNGFTNLMLAKFLAHEKNGMLEGVVEGDDGLFYTSVELQPSDFSDLGFEIKMLTHNNLLRTSFCGLVMSEDLITMTDPRKVLLNFGWSHSLMMWGGKQVRLGLLRAKALSLAYEHPRCPVLSTLAKRVLVLTNGVKPKYERNWYDMHLQLEVEKFEERTQKELFLGPSIQSRRDFAELFDISVTQQLRLEYALSRIGLEVISSTDVLSLFGPDYDDCRRYYEDFTHHTKDGPFLDEN